MPAAVILQNRTETFQGRRGVNSHGARFMLNPSPAEFSGFFAGTHGAAFIRMGKDVSFGAHVDGSIDHDTIAKSFSLAGDEVFRGYAKVGSGLQLEIWSDAEDADLIDAAERQRIDGIVAAFLSDPCMSRFKGDRELVVFSTEHGQPIIEMPIPAEVATAPDRVLLAS